ncbi:hypothetical protein ACP4OV_014423 [Aristida adscensionis]
MLMPDQVVLQVSSQIKEGVLPNGGMIAVKNLVIMSGIQEKQFQNEVNNLMRVRHQNIVRFVGYCYEARKKHMEYNGKYVFAERPKLLLCFEYMPNGSLDRYITDVSCGLDWPKCYKIIEGICRGLNYIHEEYQADASIVHLDLKPANILLMKIWCRKLQILACRDSLLIEKLKLWLPLLQDHCNGYMAPEYLFRRIITTKADIYSLGVIIIEMTTGQMQFMSDKKELIEIIPLELQFCLELEKRIPSFVKLSNKTNESVAFCFLAMGARHNLCIEPASGILWPGSVSNVSLSMHEQQQELPFDGRCNDELLVQSILVRKHILTSKTVIEDMFKNISRSLVHEVKLTVVYVRPIQPEYSMDHTGPEASLSSPTTSPDSDNRKKLVHLSGGAMAFTAEELLSADVMILRKNTYRTVYRATLEDGRRMVVHWLRKGCKEFEAEVVVHSMIQHPNLLPPRAYYLQGGQTALIFDNMSNGCLYFFLRVARASNTTAGWATRMSIAKGIARGLAYLHDKMGILHGSLTSRNVLLDDHSNPKVTAFGLHRLMMAADYCRELTTESIMVYQEPERYSIDKPNGYTDVYSLGVIILELLTGKSTAEVNNLPNWVACFLELGRASELFDQELKIGVSIDDELLDTLVLAQCCVNPLLWLRPKASEVFRKLERIRPKGRSVVHATSDHVTSNPVSREGAGSVTAGGPHRWR